MTRAHTDAEQILYRGVSMARNLAHHGRHDEVSVVARIAVDAYQDAQPATEAAAETQGAAIATDGGDEEVEDA